MIKYESSIFVTLFTAPTSTGEACSCEALLAVALEGPLGVDTEGVGVAGVGACVALIVVGAAGGATVGLDGVARRAVAGEGAQGVLAGATQTQVTVQCTLVNI